jgi:hypothetical protein
VTWSSYGGARTPVPRRIAVPASEPPSRGSVEQKKRALGQNSARTFEQASLGSQPTIALSTGSPARTSTSIGRPQAPQAVEPRASVPRAAAIPTMSYAHHVQRSTPSKAIACSVLRVVSPSIPTIDPSSTSAIPTEATSSAARRTASGESPVRPTTSSIETALPDRRSWNAARRTGSVARSIASRSSSRHPGV